MLAMAVEPRVNVALMQRLSLPCSDVVLKPSQAPFFAPRKTGPCAGLLQLSRPGSRGIGVPAASAAAEAVVAEETSAAGSSPGVAQGKEKLGVVVKPMDKPRLVLKFIWMEKNIGIALDQMIPGHGTIPLSSYYFWPRKDAWEELKVLLESKPWISQKQMIILLNQATDIINLWQQSGGDLS
ncbi:30S ribosomal protein 3, chloroplastic-like [Rhodamnia argentea]|uniref:30S ribosomal protein 3, chloroplastic-like n=1 Tax=Rhodamnia argentea TaxID=178133 RepID=A0A8B8PR83_9MYRT|nr:30S ribosomal protein 3, chloroplastic-like [Rhodamnia argentea]